MPKTELKLSNSVVWNSKDGNKDYMGSLQIAIEQFAFATRQVFLRFANGPELDLATVDMDRIAIAYFSLRGIALPTEVTDLAKAEDASWGDFVVPKRLMEKLVPRPHKKTQMPISEDPHHARKPTKGRKPRPKAGN